MIRVSVLLIIAFDGCNDPSSAVWNDFRNSFAVRKRGSLESVASRSSISNTSRSRTSMTPVVMGVQNRYDAPSEDNRGSAVESEMSKSESGQAPLDVSFSVLTPGEQRDIRAWNIRMARETVFSRFYYPEQWELRELKTIEKFLELENPREAPWFFVSWLLVAMVNTMHVLFPQDSDFLVVHTFSSYNTVFRMNLAMRPRSKPSQISSFLVTTTQSPCYLRGGQSFSMERRRGSFCSSLTGWFSLECHSILLSICELLAVLLTTSKVIRCLLPLRN